MPAAFAVAEPALTADDVVLAQSPACCGPLAEVAVSGTTPGRLHMYVRAAKEYAAADGPFQHRAAQGMLAGVFFTNFSALVAR
jgi:hypothetical protein